MADSTVKLNKDGLPEGFLQHDAVFKHIRYEKPEPGIGLITLNRPEKLNAFDETMIREIRSVIWHVNYDDSVRVLVFAGEGRAFCSGRDIHGLVFENNLPSAQYRAYVRANHEMFDDMEAIEKPLVCMVNGIAAGGGMEMAIACDFRIVATNTTFVLTENKLGVLPASGACSRLIQMIGMGRTKEMIMAARPVNGEEAYRIGLATSVHKPEELRDATFKFARELLGKAPLAMGMAKHIIHTAQNTDTETGRILERLGQSILIRSEDAQDGMAAFRDKRPPNFKAR
jgi:enoyl-CoA hydratase/carnithine racemase